jgi:hypothetical protein
MKTTLHYSLERPDGAVLGDGSIEVVAKNPLQKGKTRVRLPKTVLRLPRGAASAHLNDVRWRVSLRDVRGRVLAEKVTELT